MRKLFIAKTNRTKNNTGATSVEFAVVAALLLVILFGILEYALIFFQSHYVANAAREGARIGVRGNTYDCYKTESLPGYSTCLKDREDIVRQQVADYLDLLYDPATTYADTIVTTSDLDGSDITEDDRVLSVTVGVDNPFTNITPRLLQLLVSSSNISHPGRFTYTATMELEDQEEFDPDNL